jgi:hypothetical protein
MEGEQRPPAAGGEAVEHHLHPKMFSIRAKDGVFIEKRLKDMTALMTSYQGKPREGKNSTSPTSAASLSTKAHTVSSLTPLCFFFG